MCCDQALRWQTPAQLHTLVPELESCFTAVPLLVEVNRATDRAALANRGLSGLDTFSLSGITCSGTDFAAKFPALNLAPGVQSLGQLCPYACAQLGHGSPGSSGMTCPDPPAASKTRDIVYYGWPLRGCARHSSSCESPPHPRLWCVAASTCWLAHTAAGLRSRTAQVQLRGAAGGCPTRPVRRLLLRTRGWYLQVLRDGREGVRPAVTDALGRFPGRHAGTNSVAAHLAACILSVRFWSGPATMPGSARTVRPGLPHCEYAGRPCLL
jgi:hypothetical protein